MQATRTPAAQTALNAHACVGDHMYAVCSVLALHTCRNESDDAVCWHLASSETQCDAVYETSLRAPAPTTAVDVIAAGIEAWKRATAKSSLSRAYLSTDISLTNHEFEKFKTSADELFVYVQSALGVMVSSETLEFARRHFKYVASGVESAVVSTFIQTCSSQCSHAGVGPSASQQRALIPVVIKLTRALVRDVKTLDIRDFGRRAVGNRPNVSLQSALVVQSFVSAIMTCMRVHKLMFSAVPTFTTAVLRNETNRSEFAVSIDANADYRALEQDERSRGMPRSQELSSIVATLHGTAVQIVSDTLRSVNDEFDQSPSYFMDLYEDKIKYLKSLQEQMHLPRRISADNYAAGAVGRLKELLNIREMGRLKRTFQNVHTQIKEMFDNLETRVMRPLHTYITQVVIALGQMQANAGIVHGDSHMKNWLVTAPLTPAECQQSPLGSATTKQWLRCTSAYPDNPYDLWIPYEYGCVKSIDFGYSSTWTLTKHGYTRYVVSANVPNWISLPKYYPASKSHPEPMFYYGVAGLDLFRFVSSIKLFNQPLVQIILHTADMSVHSKCVHATSLARFFKYGNRVTITGMNPHQLAMLTNFTNDDDIHKFIARYVYTKRAGLPHSRPSSWLNTKSDTTNENARIFLAPWFDNSQVKTSPSTNISRESITICYPPPEINDLSEWMPEALQQVSKDRRKENEKIVRAVGGRPVNEKQVSPLDVADMTTSSEHRVGAPAVPTLNTNTTTTVGVEPAPLVVPVRSDISADSSTTTTTTVTAPVTTATTATVTTAAVSVQSPVIDSGDMPGVASVAAMRTQAMNFSDAAMCLYSGKHGCAPRISDEYTYAVGVYGSPSKPVSAEKKYNTIMSVMYMGPMSCMIWDGAVIESANAYSTKVPIVPTEGVKSGQIMPPKSELVSSLVRLVKKAVTDHCPLSKMTDAELKKWIAYISELVMVGLFQLEVGDLTDEIYSDDESTKTMLRNVVVKRLLSLYGFIKDTVEAHKVNGSRILDHTQTRLVNMPYGPLTKSFVISKSADADRTRADIENAPFRKHAWSLGKPSCEDKWNDRLRDYIVDRKCAAAREIYNAVLRPQRGHKELSEEEWRALL